MLLLLLLGRGNSRRSPYVALSVTALIGLVPLSLTFWPLNRVTRVMCFHLANFGLPRPFRSRVRSRHATDRQTDGRADRQTNTGPHFTMPLLRRSGHNNFFHLSQKSKCFVARMYSLTLTIHKVAIKAGNLFSVPPLYHHIITFRCHQLLRAAITT